MCHGGGCQEYPETRTANLFDRLSAASLAGVVYVLGTIGIVFKGLPALWEQLGISSDSFLGVALQGAAMLAVLVVLLVVVVAAVVVARYAQSHDLPGQGPGPSAARLKPSTASVLPTTSCRCSPPR